MLSPGAKAPEFALKDHNGQTVSLNDYRGQWLVLWWYPRACSEVCSIQGRAIVPVVDELPALGAAILGISFDNESENARFAEQEGLQFPLLSDTDRAVGRMYDVVRDPGERFEDAARRVTYIIDPDGFVAHSYAVVDAASHASVFMQDLRSLAGGAS